MTLHKHGGQRRRNAVEAHDLVVLRVEGARYGVPLDCVERVLRAVDVTPLPRAPHTVLGIIDIAGAIVPVLDLRRRLGVAERPIRLDDRLVVTRSRGRRMAIMADEVEGLCRVAGDAAHTGTALPPADTIVGAVSSAGDIVLIHDLERFFAASEEVELDSALAGL
jgi:purine-binding chemotaxis protein CheW